MSSFNTSLNSSYNRRLQYRNTLVDLLDLEDLNDNEERVTRALNAVRESRELHANSTVEESAKNPSEVYLDSRVLRQVSNVAIRSAEAFSGNVNFYDSQELATHIRLNPNFWTFILPKEVPSMGYLYGAFDPTPPEQRPRPPRRVMERQQAKALKAPAIVDKLDSAEESMPGKVHRFIKKEYKKNLEQPLSYFHLVLNPHSFSATIENIHYVSFLVQDGVIGIDIDERYGLPFITPIHNAKKDKSDITEQLIVSMDHHKWSALIKAFDITEPFMSLSR